MGKTFNSEYDRVADLDVAYTWEMARLNTGERSSRPASSNRPASSKKKYLVGASVVTGIGLMTIALLKVAGHLDLNMAATLTFMATGEILALGVPLFVYFPKKVKESNANKPEIDQKKQLRVEGFMTKLWRISNYRLKRFGEINFGEVEKEGPPIKEGPDSTTY